MQSLYTAADLVTLVALMKVSIDQVKHALIQIASQTGRPHYGMSVVREVMDAIHESTFHHLKTMVLQEIYVIYGHLYLEKRILTDEEIEVALFKLAQLKGYYAGQKALVQKTGVNERTVSLLMRGKQKLSVKVWVKMEMHIDSVLADLKAHHKLKEEISHGRYITYRNGCRCDQCKAAWREYIKALKQSKIK